MTPYHYERLKGLRARIQLLLSTQNKAGDELIEAAKEIPEASDARGTVEAVGEDLNAFVEMLQAQIEELDGFLIVNRPRELAVE